MENLWRRIQRWLRILAWKIRRPRNIALPRQQIAYDQLRQAQQIHQMSRPTDIAMTLVELGMIGNREMTMARAQEMGYAFVDLDRITIDPDAIATVSSEIAHKHKVLPLKRTDNTLYLAMSHPNDLQALDTASVASGCRVIPVLATQETIELALQRYYSEDSD
jgi:type IV pilus assembly protein PilB